MDQPKAKLDSAPAAESTNLFPTKPDYLKYLKILDSIVKSDSKIVHT